MSKKKESIRSREGYLSLRVTGQRKDLILEQAAREDKSVSTFLRDQLIKAGSLAQDIEQLKAENQRLRKNHDDVLVRLEERRQENQHLTKKIRRILKRRIGKWLFILVGVAYVSFILGGLCFG